MMTDILLGILKERWYEVAISILGLGFFAKWVTVRSVATKFFAYVKSIIKSREDKEISEAEYADIGRKAVDFSDEVVGRLKGFFPNRSKTE